jgi:hypothetical protein
VDLYRRLVSIGAAFKRIVFNILRHCNQCKTGTDRKKKPLNYQICRLFKLFRRFWFFYKLLKVCKKRLCRLAWTIFEHFIEDLSVLAELST